MDLSISQQVLYSGFLLAVVMGAVSNRTNFCTMGAVSDWVNMGDTSRMRSWLLAIAVALIGVIFLEWMEVIATDPSRPPYRTAVFAWPRYILGGLMFGVGMTLASGCGNKILIRIGGGNLKSVVVLVIASIFAYLMTKTAFYEFLFYNWITPISIDLAKSGISGQDLGSLVSYVAGMDDPVIVRLAIGIALAAVLLYYVFRSKDFRGNLEHIIGGLVVGLCVLGGWYVTAGSMGREWQEATEFMDQVPFGVGPQSYTFVNPMGESLDYLMSSMRPTLLTFGVMALTGVIVGSFLYAITTKNFRIEWFASRRDFITHAIGAVLMGIGGVLAMGCTIGQGITGISTLAVGSFMAFFSIVIGSALTMKVQYYRLVYEEEATFGKALLTGMADLHLLPDGMRKLDPA